MARGLLIPLRAFTIIVLFAYQGKGQLEKALMDYNEAIRIEPKYAIAYSIRGSAYSSLGKGVGHRL